MIGMSNYSSRALLAAALLVLVAPSGALAAGKTLKETLAFIRSSLVEQGKITYSIKMHDSADGSDWSQAMSGEASRITYDTGNCTVSYHWETFSDGKQVQNFDTTWYLAKGKKVGMVSREEEIRQQAINGGNSTWTAIVAPPMWVVTITFTDTSGVANFTDKSKAEKFMRAIDHAMELCGAPKESF
jgi:hypothetical protein